MSKTDDEIYKAQLQFEDIIEKHQKKTTNANFEKAGFEHPVHIDLCFFFLNGIKLYFDLKKINNSYRDNQEALKDKADAINVRIRHLDALSRKLNKEKMKSVSENDKRIDMLISRKTIFTHTINVQIVKFKANGYVAAEKITVGGRRKSTVRHKRSGRKTRRH
jgi:hypothetical protein